jgi:heterodisulfide reductase subunit B
MNNNAPIREVSYYPGCSLATTARESNQSLISACRKIGLELVEMEDWNCCGSSSTHSLDLDMALKLAARVLALAPPHRPLMTMCPSCYKNLRCAQIKLNREPETRREMEKLWGRLIDPDLEIVSFLEILWHMDRDAPPSAPPEGRPLAGLTIAPYNGCMTMFPPVLRREALAVDLLDKKLKDLGADVVNWSGRNRCCGTFLTVSRPDVTEPLINRIMEEAVSENADCLVTACAMCQLNMEIRCTTQPKLPIFHFSEILALALGETNFSGWFKRHLIDPRPVLKEKLGLG